MRIKYKGVIALILLISVLLISLSSCDLGDYADEEEYAKIIDKVVLVDEELDEDNYSISDFYNKETSENMATPVEDFAPYRYLSFRVSEARFLEDFALYFIGNAAGTLEMCAFISDSPSEEEEEDENPLLDTFYGEVDGVQYSAEFVEKEEDDVTKKLLTYKIGDKTYTANFFDYPGEDCIGFTIIIGGIGHIHKCYIKPTELDIVDTYNNKTVSLKSLDQLSYLATATISISSEEWTALHVSDLYVSGVKTKRVPINGDYYVVLKFMNNCSTAQYYNLAPVSIKMTNLMVRLLKADGEE